MEKILVSYYEDFYYGSISGLFICTQADLDKVIGRDIHYGECLGKHSEVSHTLNETNFEIKSDDQAMIALLEATFDSPTISGTNPVLVLFPNG